MARHGILRRCRNCTVSQQAKAEAPPSPIKAPLESAPWDLSRDAAQSPPEPVKTLVADGCATEANQQVEDAALKQESPIEREAAPTWRGAESNLPQQERTNAEQRVSEGGETEAVLVEISQDGARAAPQISANGLSVASDANNKLTVVCGVDSAPAQRLTSELKPVSTVPEACDPMVASEPDAVADSTVSANALSMSCDVGNKLMLVASAALQAEALPQATARLQLAGPPESSTSMSPAVCLDMLSMTNSDAAMCRASSDAALLLRAASAETKESIDNGSSEPHANALTPQMSNNALTLCSSGGNKLMLTTPAASVPAGVKPRAARVLLNIEPLAHHRGASMKRASLALRRQRQCNIARTPAGEGLGVAMVLLGDVVRVSALKPTGAVAAWNSNQRPRRQLLSGATIMAVNGISGDASSMRDALKSGDEWHIAFRPAPVQAELADDATDDDMEVLDDARSNSVHEAMSMASSFATSVAAREELAMWQATDGD